MEMQQKVLQNRIIDFGKVVSKRNVQKYGRANMPFKYEPGEIIGSVRNEGDKSPGVYQKLDYIKAIFRNCTINEVLDWVGLDPNAFSSNFLESAYTTLDTCSIVFRMEFNHILIQIKQADYDRLDKSGNLFVQNVANIDLIISGQGLDFLRFNGIDVDTLYRDESRWNPAWHFTRVDFAYDFINYRADFVEQFLKYCRENQTPGQRIVCGSKKSFIWRYWDVRAMCVWIGSRGSKRFLRAYDKRIEQSNFDTKTYVKPNPYGNPDSWIRIEWEVHDDVAQKLILDAAPMSAILKELFEYYDFQDVANTTERSRKTADFWFNLFDWNFLQSTVQNLNFI